MPIIKHKSEYVAFLHIPKCAGTTIENLLTKDNSSIGLYDPLWWSREEKTTCISPQHLQITEIKKLLGLNKISSFALVRNPQDRFLSAYNYNIKIGTISPLKRRINFIESLSGSKFKHQFYDNHFRPAVEFIDDETVIFRLEDGLDKLSEWMLDNINLRTNGYLKVVHQPNKITKNKRTRINSILNESPTLTTDEVSLVNEYYWNDFKAFGYKMNG